MFNLVDEITKIGKTFDAIDAKPDAPVPTPDDALCLLCETRPVDTAENPYSDLCCECRKRALHYPVPKWLFIVLLIILAAIIFAMTRLPETLDDFRIYKKAQASYNTAYFFTSADAYLLLSEKYPNAQNINEKTFLALAKSQRLEEACNFFNERLAGKNAEEENYEEIDRYVTMLDRYYATLEAIDTSLQNQTSSDQIDKIYGIVEPLLENESCSDSVILFYLAQLNIGRGKTAEAVDQLKNACAMEPRLSFLSSWLGNAQRRVRQYENAAATYNAALAVNAEDTGAIKGLGIIALLKGEKQTGLEYIQQAYRLDPYDIYVADAYIVALKCSDREDEAVSLYEEIKNSEGYEEDPEMEDYMAGKITIEQLYLE